VAFLQAGLIFAASATAFALALSLPDNWHSHATKTRHPAALSCLLTRLSRATLRSNFSRQKAVFVFGVVAILQPRCLCQKHPWTKTTAQWRGNAMSGLPGKLAWSL
jgi:hypothetical protein